MSAAPLSALMENIWRYIHETRGLEADLRIPDAQSGETVKSIARDEGAGERLFAVSPDGSLVAMKLNKEGACMFNIQTGEQIDLNMDSSNCKVCFSPDSKRLAYSTGSVPDHCIKVIGLPKGNELLSIPAGNSRGRGKIYSISYSPDGRLLAAGMSIGVVLWDARNGSKIFELDVGGVDSIAFNPDGSRIATAGGGGICILDAKSGNVLLKFEGLDTGNIRFSPDGKALVASEGRSDAIKIISAETGEVLKQLLGNCVDWASYTPDGKKLVSCESSRMVKFWVGE